VKRIIEPAAEAETNEAAAYYEAQREGLGQEFLREVTRTLDIASENPLLYARVHRKPLRKAPVSRFPYVIYYRIETDHLRIIAILHGRRHPRTWRRRA
jgi:plasmid stabilization system protein ParE